MKEKTDEIRKQTLIKLKNVKNLNEYGTLPDKEMLKQVKRILNEHEEQLDKEMNKWI